MSEITKNTATEINELHKAIENRLKQSLSDAIKLGGLLAGVKDSLPHGEFTKWIESNLDFTTRTARNYLKLHNNRKQLRGVDSITDAYRLLKPKTETLSDLDEAPPKERTLDSYVKVITGLENYPAIANKIEFQKTGLVFHQETTPEEWKMIGHHLTTLNRMSPPKA